MAEGLDSFLAELGFEQPTVESCYMAQDPTKRVWSRKVCLSDNSWSVHTTSGSYTWVGLCNSEKRMVAKALCIRLILPDLSEYYSCLCFPHLTETQPNILNLYQFYGKVFQELKRVTGQEGNLKLYSGPNIRTHAESVATQTPLVYGRGTKGGMYDWLNSLTEKELEKLSGSI